MKIFHLIIITLVCLFIAFLLPIVIYIEYFIILDVLSYDAFARNILNAQLFSMVVILMLSFLAIVKLIEVNNNKKKEI